MALLTSQLDSDSFNGIREMKLDGFSDSLTVSQNQSLSNFLVLSQCIAPILRHIVPTVSKASHTFAECGVNER
jgi:hypothetical protein